jgi:hypothetical protein
LPAAAQRLEERHRGIEAVEPHLRELVLRVEQGALRIEHREQVVRALAVAHFGEAQRFARTLLDLRLQDLPLLQPGCGGERAFHVGERRARGDQLIDAMYRDERVVSDRTVDSHIKKIRRKIAALEPERELIHSLYGVGYKYEP